MKSFLEEFNFNDNVKDNKLNLSGLLSNTTALISDELVAMTILGVLYAKDSPLYKKFESHVGGVLTEEQINGAKASANIMNMNNVFYRGKHFLGSDYANVSAGLRMNIYTKHGIDKMDFEFIALAVSFINNCEFCIKSHAKILEKHGMSKDKIHEALRIAAIVNTLREEY